MSEKKTYDELNLAVEELAAELQAAKAKLIESARSVNLLKRN
jgi:hypothetical protein